jgi:hypothetical protein
MTQKANYVIAAPWPDSDGALCTYNIFGEVHFGTMKEAYDLLGVIQEKIARDDRHSYEPKAEDFQIYQVVPIK